MPEKDGLWDEAILTPEHIEGNTRQSAIVDGITDEIKNCLECLLFSQCYGDIVPTPACGSVYDELQKNKFY